MGLLYPFPVSAEETDFVKLQLSPLGEVNSVTVRSYGLPYIFWAYAAASLTVVLFLWIAVKDPLEKLSSLGGPDALLALALKIFLISLPLTVMGFFFYEKILSRTKNQFKIQHKLFGIPFFNKIIEASALELLVLHHLDAPNVARLKGGEQAVGFQNKGYFTLWLKAAQGIEIQLDRHSRKNDLESLKALLSLPAKSE
ncbi:MAG: DUF3488 domain-containing protein [Bacteriovoracaceae bacterium]|nr:DUF3488 domain-containing protein [Bacteriovoracaceae bacterium]